MPTYAIYARKSTESEDRQVLSIESQIKELEQMARARGHAVGQVLTESRSAKEPGRIVFGQLMRLVSRGKIDGVMSWKLDRLARNPVDGAALIWAMDQGRLQEVAIPGRTFTNRGDDKLMMQIEFGMAKKYVDDLSDNVKRGNRAKLEMGWLPCRPPLGYLNDREAKTIVSDPERFPLIRRAFDYVLAGDSPALVLRRLNREWGFHTRRFRRMGGKALQPSHFYRMLSNPFYSGLLVYAGETYVGQHEPLVTRDEFEEVQRLLGRANRTHTHRRTFAYTGLIVCGECGAAVTAEHKINRYGSEYTYYRCTKRKVGVTCSQKTIQLGELEAQIRAYLKGRTIDDEIAQWALEKVQALRSESATARTTILRTLATSEEGVKKQLTQLTDLRLRSLITDEEFSAKRGELVAHVLTLKQKRETAERDSASWLELFENVLIFANHAEKRFAAGDAAEKRQILIATGSHFSLKDRTLRIDVPKYLSQVTEDARKCRWQAIVDGIRTFYLEESAHSRWPRFVLEHGTPNSVDPQEG